MHVEATFFCHPYVLLRLHRYQLLIALVQCHIFGVPVVICIAHEGNTALTATEADFVGILLLGHNVLQLFLFRLDVEEHDSGPEDTVDL